MNLDAFILYDNDNGAVMYPIDAFADPVEQLVRIAGRNGDHPDEFDAFYCVYENRRWITQRWNGEVFE